MDKPSIQRPFIRKPSSRLGGLVVVIELGVVVDAEKHKESIGDGNIQLSQRAHRTSGNHDG